MNAYEKPLSELDELIGELNTASSNLFMLTLLIESMDAAGIPNRITFTESLNAVGYHLDRIRKDAARVLDTLLDVSTG